MKLVKYFVMVIIVIAIFELLFFANFWFGFVFCSNLSGVGVLTIWASVITIVFLVFSVIGLLQIDSRVKELGDVKEHLTSLHSKMEAEFKSITSSAEEERKKIVAQAEKELIKIINVSMERQNLYDRLTKISNVMFPNERITLYTNFLQTNPKTDGINYAFVYLCRGDSYKELGRFDKAKNDYERAKEITPEDESPYLSLGIYYAELKCYDESIQYFQKALDLQPMNALTCVNIGNSYAALGKFKESEKFYDRAKDINPEVADIYYNYAIFYKDSGRDPNKTIAEDYYKHCLEINPLFYRARINLASTYKDRKDFPAAIEEYTKVIAYKPNQDIVIAILQRGICNRLLGNIGAAVVDFNQVYYITPNNVQNLANLAISHLVLSHYKEAAEFTRMGIAEANRQNQHSCDEDFKRVVMELNKIGYRI